MNSRAQPILDSGGLARPRTARAPGYAMAAVLAGLLPAVRDLVARGFLGPAAAP